MTVEGLPPAPKPALRSIRRSYTVHEATVEYVFTPTPPTQQTPWGGSKLSAVNYHSGTRTIEIEGMAPVVGWPSIGSRQSRLQDGGMTVLIELTVIMGPN